MYFEHENPFSSMPNLRTERLLLRKLNMHDAQDVYDYSSDPLVAKHVLWDAHTAWASRAVGAWNT